MKAYNINFQIYADDEQEVSDAKRAIVMFIGELANSGHAVTGKKIAEVIPKWKDNVFVKNKILNYFKQ